MMLSVGVCSACTPKSACLKRVHTRINQHCKHTEVISHIIQNPLSTRIAVQLHYDMSNHLLVSNLPIKEDVVGRDKASRANQVQQELVVLPIRTLVRI